MTNWMIFLAALGSLALALSVNVALNLQGDRILRWLVTPTKAQLKYWHVAVLWLIIAALTSLIFILGEGVSK